MLIFIVFFLYAGGRTWSLFHIIWAGKWSRQRGMVEGPLYGDGTSLRQHYPGSPWGRYTPAGVLNPNKIIRTGCHLRPSLSKQWKENPHLISKPRNPEPFFSAPGTLFASHQPGTSHNFLKFATGVGKNNRTWGRGWPCKYVGWLNRAWCNERPKIVKPTKTRNHVCQSIFGFWLWVCSEPAPIVEPGPGPLKAKKPKKTICAFIGKPSIYQ